MSGETLKIGVLEEKSTFHIFKPSYLDSVQNLCKIVSSALAMLKRDGNNNERFFLVKVNKLKYISFLLQEHYREWRVQITH